LLRHGLVLGLAQGPTELLPVSSSAHTTLIPLLAGWPAAELDRESRKALEVALHAGGAAALLLLGRRELAGAAHTLDLRAASLLMLSLAPPALVGYTLEGPIERRLGGRRTIAAGLLLGAVAMALADRTAGREDGSGTRALGDAGPLDGLLLGLAQALALMPGISRNGATLAVARARGFDRKDSQTLSWRVALPVIVGASALKGKRLSERAVPTDLRFTLLTGATAAFLSTLASAPLIAPQRRGRALAPFSIYRCALATLALAVPTRASKDKRHRTPKKRGRGAPLSWTAK
jgi:undecaprenyl-diphosphatase